MSANFIKRKNFKDILKRYSEGKCTPAEETLVEEWYNSIENDAPVSFSASESSNLEETLWRRISSKTAVVQVSSGTWSNLYYSRAAQIAIAAILVVGFIAFSLTINIHESSRKLAYEEKDDTSIFNTGSSKKLIHLEDGSLITLQPKSSLHFPKHFQKEKREITLIGEAFFEVAHDQQRPFFVYTKNVITRVLGTSFTVRAGENDASVMVCVKTGRVSVSRESAKFFGIRKTVKEEVILIPNQKAILDVNNDKEVMTMLVDDPQPVSTDQKASVMKFDEEPVPAILQALEKMYGVKILFDQTQLKSCALTTVLSEEGLYERLNIICKAIDGSYEIQGTNIILKSRGCKLD